MQAVERALFVLEYTRQRGVITGPTLTSTPGWNRVLAHRYLTFLNQVGWLEKVSDKGNPRYVLGRKALAMAPELSL